MDKLVRTFTITDDWAPLPWSVFSVVPLRDERGAVLAFAENVYKRDRVGLPKEFFSHGMREVNVNDAAQLAKFMSEYGLVGSRRSRGLMTDSVMDVKTVEDAHAVDKRYGIRRGAKRRWTGEEVLSWYRSLQKAAEEAEIGWLLSSQSLNNLHQGRLFVTAYEAVESFKGLLTAAEVAALLLRCDEPRKVAEELEMNLEDMFNYVAYWEGYINELLQSLCPQMELRLQRDGVNSPLPIEEYEKPEREGSFDQAVALQIYKYSLAKNRYKICKECGIVFVERETKGRKGPSRSTAKFCSDKCHNRYSQREKRQRDSEKRRGAME